MKNILEKIKPLNNIFVLVIIFLVVYLFLISGSMSNHAMIVNEPDNSFNQRFLIQKDVSYSFNIADKLEGAGQVRLVVDNDKLTGIASGVGSTYRGKIDLHSKLDGNVDRLSGEIKLVINGIGDPVGVPGKVSFQGPIIGSLVDNKLRLVGDVDINGWVAACAGFGSKEELVIEINDKAIVKMLKKATHNLAMR